MKLKFTTEEAVNRLKKMNFIGIALIIINLILIIKNLLTRIDSFVMLFDSLAYLIMIIVAIIISITNSKKIKEISGEYFEFDESTLTIEKNNQIFTFDSVNKPEKITVNLKNIIIKDNTGKDVVLVIANYTKNFSEIKKIKELFSNFK